MADPVSSTPNTSSLVQDVDVTRLVDVRCQMTSSPPPLQQQQQPAFSTLTTSLSTLPMPDVVRESFIDDSPTSISPVAHTSLHPALLVILNFVSFIKMYVCYVYYACLYDCMLAYVSLCVTFIVN